MYVYLLIYTVLYRHRFANWPRYESYFRISSCPTPCPSCSHSFRQACAVMLYSSVHQN